MGKALLDHQPDLAGDFVDVLQRQVALGHVGADPQHILLAHVEGHPDRIDLDDGGELGRRGDADQGAHRLEMVGDHPVEGRLHLGVAEIDRGDVDPGLGIQDVGIQRVALRPGLVEVRLGAVAFRRQIRLALQLRLGIGPLGLQRLQLRLGLGQLGLVGRLLDDKECLALLDGGAVHVVDIGQEAFDPGLEIDLVHRHRIAGVVDIGRHRDVERLGDPHRRRRRGNIGVFFLLAGHQQEERGSEGERGPRPWQTHPPHAVLPLCP